MIKLNLLDDDYLAQNKSQANSSVLPSTPVPKNVKKWFTIGVSIASVALVGILLYYFFGIKGPLSDLKSEFITIKAEIKKSEPLIEQTNVLEKEYNILNSKITEFDIYVNSKKHWSRIMNIISDITPDEIVFNKFFNSSGQFKQKTRTKSGLKSIEIDADILQIDIEISEESQNKISLFMSKIRKDKYLKPLILDVQNTGLALSNRVYKTSLKIFLNKNLISDDNKDVKK